MGWSAQVDVVFADVAQPDQSRIVALNSHMFLKNGGHFMISIKANCVDSTADPALVFAQEVNKLKAEQFKPAEQVQTLPFSAAPTLSSARCEGFFNLSRLLSFSPL